jgi:hypothetical protein
MARLSKQAFVPLADVPDMVWKVGHKRGGMTSPEHANHFADMDRELDPRLPQGATLLEICAGRPGNVDVDLWRQYYSAVQKQFPKEHESRGLLPFRVWQIYDAMTSFIRQGKPDEFVCAAGILSHYVGDSCQPLHISYLFNRDPDHTVDGVVRDPQTGEKKRGPVPLGLGVHSAYEDQMIDRHVPEMMKGVDGILARARQPALVTSGHDAAVAVVNLMQQTFRAIPPKDIVAEFVKVQDQKPAQRADAMWRSLAMTPSKSWPTVASASRSYGTALGKKAAAIARSTTSIRLMRRDWNSGIKTPAFCRRTPSIPSAPFFEEVLRR